MSRQRWLIHLVLVLVAIVVVFPFYWMISTSLKTLQEALRVPPVVFPTMPQLGNYPTAFRAAPFPRYFLNTAFVAGLTTLLSLLFSSLAAFAFAKMRFPGRQVLFLGMLATLMVPFEVQLIPDFVIIRHLPLLGGNDVWGNGGKGLYDTYWAQIVPWAASPFGVFLMRQFFLSLPNDFYEAAQLDGATRFVFFSQVALPLARPALITAGLFGFLGSWNALLWPLVVTSSPEVRPIQVGLATFSTEQGTQYHLLMAAATLVMLPVVVLYLVAQRQFTEGVASSGLKG
ncbi:MAG TPA: carbohydrate ABC transporter permease [Chloroflexota bacterium]|nr:carbohydrate ABC transporter permease [Chloroflexota bacterium]